MSEQWVPIREGDWHPRTEAEIHPGYRFMQESWWRDLAFRPDTPDLVVNSQGQVWNTIAQIGGDTVSLGSVHYSASAGGTPPMATVTIKVGYIDVSDPHALIVRVDEAGHPVFKLTQPARVLIDGRHTHVWVAGQEEPFCTSLTIDMDANRSGPSPMISLVLRDVVPLAEVRYDASR